MGFSSRTRAVTFGLAGLLFVAAFAVLAAGVDRPTTSRQVPREQATILLAIDTSFSMQATDVEPNRMQAAKTAATAFVDMVPPTVDVGLVPFNSRATLAVAPTTDHDRLKDGIAHLTMGESTAIGEAVFASLQAIAAVPSDPAHPPPPAHIVLLSDGKTQIGRSDESAARAAAAAGVPVTTIAFGREDGYIVAPDEPDKHLPVPVDRDALGAIAGATKGSYFEAASPGELRRAYEEIATTVAYTTVGQRDSPAPFVVGALALLLAASAVSMAGIVSWHRARQRGHPETSAVGGDHPGPAELGPTGPRLRRRRRGARSPGDRR
jgi:Ca-activated chloride channel family protein